MFAAYVSTIGPVTNIDGDVLEGVSATTLWTLRNRATEAKRFDGVIRDPWAVTLLDAIDYDYDRFGRPSQVHALRALAFDTATRAYLTTHPKAAVVALAEGLQTSLWRLDSVGVACELTWYSVDLPPVIALREQLLPRDERIVELAQSALNRSWMDRVDDSGGALITAEGLPRTGGRARPDPRLRGPLPRRTDGVRLGAVLVQPAHAQRPQALQPLPHATDAVRVDRGRSRRAGRPHPRGA
jgi:hypothetical protein